MLIQEIYETADESTVHANADAAAEQTAMAASFGKGKRRGARGDKKDLKCDNCDRTGHIKRDCWSKGGGKEGQSPWTKGKGKKKASDSANSAAKDDSDSDYNVATSLVMMGDVDDEPSETALTISLHSNDIEALSATSTSSKKDILVDAGATRHFSPDRDSFINFVEIPPVPIRAADGRTFSATGRGDLKVPLPMGDGEKPTRVLFTNTYYSPHLAFTLLSVSCLDRKGWIIHFEEGTCVLGTPRPKSRIVGRIPLIRGLYRIPASVPSNPKKDDTPIAASTSRLMSISELHRKMGHINHDDLRDMVRKGMVTGIELDMNSKPEFCESCTRAKATRKPFPKKSKSARRKVYGGKVVGDTWGPAEVTSLGGKDYSLTFQDRHSHEEKAYFMRKKSEALEKYKEYEAWIKVQRKSNIEIFGSDGGGEFKSNAFSKHLRSQGTVQHLTVHDSPAQNGASERSHRMHVECS
jgi:hypothetical protein